MEVDILGGIGGLSVVLGHYGSGKTEFAVNLALALADAGRRVMIADLDFVNPFFRSRERKELFLERGIDLVGSPPGCSDSDVPALDARINILFEDPSVTGVIDAGGDSVGARVLRRFATRLSERGARAFIVINAARPRTDTPEGAIRYMRDIEEASGLTLSGIVHNTHLLYDTTLPDILEGADLVERVSQATGVPVFCHMVGRKLAREAESLISPIFPADIYMRKPWEI